ncbi:ribosomal RNA small subunit methyltransferase A [Patescibacteria group bacterium]|nr:ribosomal RNA small subunit methyltransferase A [Patescibacteria group bacterium]MBU0879745.1 ribosomal RNA small subunit methyltransferase A [Patescibacteria group bacterium]MBU0880216.1 ribosomal RNA small subunit methyltransferase A [Patescibacteria group bacterium]MBU0897671.1 ribosomal RNA small subunit methyltransferase A [Patescibacteria group bacterium]MBU1783021.1 ribosomal RNA small subunit methyltransferase A [Patescibacteria group bacterium]
MNLLQQTRDLCNLYEIKPARSKGQNFLIKEEVYDEIIASADLKPDDIVLEVGPGLGFLTAKLASKVKQVIAVELDDKLAEILRIGLMSQGVKNVEVVNKNVLDFSMFNCKSGTDNLQEYNHSNLLYQGGVVQTLKYKIVANLPFNITSIFLRKFLEADVKPELMVLMLQKEVAERIIAKPPKMSLLAVSVQLYSQPEIIKIVSADNFWPKPAVDSAIIKLKVESLKLKVREEKSQKLKVESLKLKVREEKSQKLKVESLKLKVSEKDFFRLVKIGFSSKRKMLKNNLANGYKIEPNEVENKLKNIGLDVKIRAEGLSVDNWLKLFGEF